MIFSLSIYGINKKERRGRKRESTTTLLWSFRLPSRLLVNIYKLNLLYTLIPMKNIITATIIIKFFCQYMGHGGKDTGKGERELQRLRHTSYFLISLTNHLIPLNNGHTLDSH